MICTLTTARLSMRKWKAVMQDSPDWRKEKITFDAAYGKERATAYLFLPAHVKPPFQTVAFFPSGRALDRRLERNARGHKVFRVRDSAAGARCSIRFIKERTNGRPPGRDRTPRRGARSLIQDSKDHRPLARLPGNSPGYRPQSLRLHGRKHGGGIGRDFCRGGRPFQGRDLYRWWILRR